MRKRILLGLTLFLGIYPLVRLVAQEPDWSKIETKVEKVACDPVDNSLKGVTKNPS